MDKGAAAASEKVREFNYSAAFQHQSRLKGYLVTFEKNKNKVFFPKVEQTKECRYDNHSLCQLEFCWIGPKKRKLGVSRVPARMIKRVCSPILFRCVSIFNDTSPKQSR